jgi:hypothetical protein
MCRTRFFPNPFEDKFSIHVPGYSGFNVTIFDITGKVVQRVKSSSDLVNVNMPGEMAGIYFCQLTSGDQNEIIGRGKLIKK